MFLDGVFLRGKVLPEECVTCGILMIADIHFAQTLLLPAPLFLLISYLNIFRRGMWAVNSNYALALGAAWHAGRRVKDAAPYVRISSPSHPPRSPG